MGSISNLYDGFTVKCMFIFFLAIADIASDVFVAQDLFTRGDYIWGVIVGGGIIFSNLLCAFIMMKGQFLDSHMTFKNRILRYPMALLSILGLGVPMSILQSLVASYKGDLAYRELRFQKSQVLRVSEVIFESCPQIIIQAYAGSEHGLFSDFQLENLYYYASLLFSCISIGVVMLSLEFAIRTNENKPKINTGGVISLFVFRISEGLTNMLAVALVASILRGIVAVFVAIDILLTWLLLCISHRSTKYDWKYKDAISGFRKDIWSILIIGTSFVFYVEKQGGAGFKQPYLSPLFFFFQKLIKQVGVASLILIVGPYYSDKTTKMFSIFKVHDYSFDRIEYLSYAFLLFCILYWFSLIMWYMSWYNLEKNSVLKQIDNPFMSEVEIKEHHNISKLSDEYLDIIKQLTDSNFMPMCKDEESTENT